MIPGGRRNAYVVGVVPFFFSIFLIRKRMINAKDTKEKERRRNHYSPPAFSMTKIAIIKRDKDSLRIYIDYGSKTLLILW